MKGIKHFCMSSLPPHHGLFSCSSTPVYSYVKERRKASTHLFHFSYQEGERKSHPSLHFNPFPDLDFFFSRLWFVRIQREKKNPNHSVRQSRLLLISLKEIHTGKWLSVKRCRVNKAPGRCSLYGANSMIVAHCGSTLSQRGETEGRKRVSAEHNTAEWQRRQRQSLPLTAAAWNLLPLDGFLTLRYLHSAASPVRESELCRLSSRFASSVHSHS